MALFFNSEALGTPRGEYVAWCDGMGTGRSLVHSLDHAANFIFKLHRAFSEAVRALWTAHSVRIYPLMDGMYVTTRNSQEFQKVLRKAFDELAAEFLAHDQFTHHFVVRGGIAYGATMHGSDIPDEAFVHGIGTQHESVNRQEFSNSALSRIVSQLLLSSAMLPAYKSESLAPPFGLYVDDSALSIPQLVDTKDKGFFSKFWNGGSRIKGLGKGHNDFGKACKGITMRPNDENMNCHIQ